MKEIIELIFTLIFGVSLAIYGMDQQEENRKADLIKNPKNIDTLYNANTVEEPKDPETKAYKLCDVDMPEDLQIWLFDYCEQMHISPYLIIAMCERESDFNPNCIYDNGDSIGIMQIQPKWHYERMERLGVHDLTDAQGNIKVGIDFLLELFERNNNVEWVLMAYNGGQAYANRKINNGEVSEYAKYIINRAIELESR